MPGSRRKTITELNITDTGSSLISVRRGRERIEVFNNDFQFNIGDAVVIEGMQSAISSTEKYLLIG